MTLVILKELCADWKYVHRSGIWLRSALRESGFRKSIPGFYAFMSRMVDQGFVGKYRANYEITPQIKTPCAWYYLTVAGKNYLESITSAEAQ